VIEVSNLWCGYPQRDVLRAVNFTIQAGEFVGILGPNGSGKTTLMLALSGVIGIRQGQITIQGAPLQGLAPRKRAQRTAVVAQEGAVRLPFSCAEVVRMGRYPHQQRWRLETPRDVEVVRRAMELTDAGVLAERLITAISGGEKQRVMMARALAQETPILLLDESTSAMDIHRKLQMFKVLEQLNREEGTTILTVLHDINLAALFCDRIIFLRDGEKVADGPPHEMLTTEVLEEIYCTRVLVQEIACIGKKQVVFLP
jgi:iron complex transport system ATP-binding protein